MGFYSRFQNFHVDYSSSVSAVDDSIIQVVFRCRLIGYHCCNSVSQAYNKSVGVLLRMIGILGKMGR